MDGQHSEERPRWVWYCTRRATRQLLHGVLASFKLLRDVVEQRGGVERLNLGSGDVVVLQARGHIGVDGRGQIVGP